MAKLLFPTSVVGSMPRSTFVQDLINRKPPLSDERYSTDADFDVVDRLAQVAAERGAPPAQVALAWLLGRPGVTAPIVGATKLGHISDALAAIQLTLTEQEAARLEEPYVPHPVLAHR
jgi:aryl-alcohol dehydrogenase-like predicted oxidoreductase